MPAAEVLSSLGSLLSKLIYIAPKANPNIVKVKIAIRVTKLRAIDKERLIWRGIMYKKRENIPKRTKTKENILYLL